MTQVFPLQLSPTPQIVTIPGGIIGSANAFIGFATAPSAGTITVEARQPGSAIWRLMSRANAVSITTGEISVRVDGDVAALRITFTGLVGGTLPSLWLTANEEPLGLYSGLAATTFQNYIEANVKNGVQYETSSDNLTVGIGANIDVIFTTGANPVIIKNRLVKFNGTHITTRVYRGPTFTGGSITPYFNLNDRNPVAGTATIRTGATVTAPGTEFGAPTFDIGSAGQGNSSLSTYSTLGIERLLAPNTVYLQRITNDSAAVQEISSYLTWYEGGTDLPL
jgi:hypothetical protein